MAQEIDTILQNIVACDSFMYSLIMCRRFQSKHYTLLTRVLLALLYKRESEIRVCLSKNIANHGHPFFINDTPTHRVILLRTVVQDDTLYVYSLWGSKGSGSTSYNLTTCLKIMFRRCLMLNKFRVLVRSVLNFSQPLRLQHGSRSIVEMLLDGRCFCSSLDDERRRHLPHDEVAKNEISVD